MKKHNFGELNQLYIDGENADKSIFSEMRSNCLLFIGDHYQKVTDKLLERLRESRLSETVKLKLVKNHIQVVCKNYINNIVSMAPGVQFTAYNENELQDQKDSELSQAVWADAEVKQFIDEKINKWAQSFVVVGEMAAEVYFDPNKGAFKGWKQKVNSSGEPLFIDPMMGEIPSPVDIMGNQLEPAKSDIPVFEGDLCIDVIHPFNLIRPKEAESMKDAAWLCVRTMMGLNDAKNLVLGADNLTDEEKDDKLQYIQESSKGTFQVFDGTKGAYTEVKDQVLVRKYFFRPCAKYPDGYFYITTEQGILFEGSLPFGIFPIVTEGFDEIPTSPRYRSIIKPLRSPQTEINRMASMRATTQITLGDDKVITQVNSRMQKGTQWAGIREFIVNGPPPTILPGRSGDQFAASLQEEIQELYRLANMEYENEERTMQDPQAMLYASLRQRKKYTIYVQKFERFLCNVAKLHNSLAKHYYDDTKLIRATGRREAINIAEFRQMSEAGFTVKAKPVSQDSESLLGKSLHLQYILQYIGKDLPKHVQGLILKQMPFVNDEQTVKYLTVELDGIESDILALDRGEYRPAEKEDDHELYIMLLTARKKQGDYKMLPQQVKEMYEQKINEHRQMSAQVAQELKAAQSEFIPVTGGLIKVDMYGPDGKRITLPYDAVQWLVEHLDKQGQGQQKLEMLDQYNQARILANSMNQQQGMGPAAGMQQPAPIAS